MKFDEALYDYSYKNLMLYLAVLPTYDTDKDKNPDSGTISADDPANDALIDRLFN